VKYASTDEFEEEEEWILEFIVRPCALQGRVHSPRKRGMSVLVGEKTIRVKLVFHIRSSCDDDHPPSQLKEPPNNVSNNLVLPLQEFGLVSRARCTLISCSGTKRQREVNRR
jgi:hypothetical protein